MSGLPLLEPAEVRLEEPFGSLEALAAAGCPAEVEAVAARWPACLAAWAELGRIALEAGRPVEAYACFRVGYHRGLDRLRRAGWKGSGQVRWAHPGNRGFLGSVRGLSIAAGELGEGDEAERCAAFVAELDPEAAGPG